LPGSRHGQRPPRGRADTLTVHPCFSEGGPMAANAARPRGDRGGAGTSKECAPVGQKSTCVNRELSGHSWAVMLLTARQHGVLAPFWWYCNSHSRRPGGAPARAALVARGHDRWCPSQPAYSVTTWLGARAVHASVVAEARCGGVGRDSLTGTARAVQGSQGSCGTCAAQACR
jgi:hypothetical protein